MKLKAPSAVRPARWTDQLRSHPAISIRQPYGWLVTRGIKDIENRSWRTHKRGSVLIHASMNREFLSADVVEDCETISGVRLPESYDVGGIVGVAEIVDCVQRHPSPWKQRGSWGWVLANARPLPFRECKGAVGFFHPFASLHRPIHPA